jgi:hypothetical protein
MSSMDVAVRFLKGMESFSSKVDLLSELTDNRNYGKKRIHNVLSFINSMDDVRTLLVPLLCNVMTEETNRTVYRPCLV